ncbi:hypothetical protein BJ875DRAFT_453973 [Amylocarpus encephaloides]|uniref:Uncharacterized protein n=1 Tax=Amylocarpus encephaloides TaxID=45428 RepID=A0A9P7YQE3_9HELO|nr:hypothetical protein BJ875DRAFT_453973 [Amylocarpus encephaloides]
MAPPWRSTAVSYVVQGLALPTFWRVPIACVTSGDHLHRCCPTGEVVDTGLPKRTEGPAFRLGGVCAKIEPRPPLPSPPSDGEQKHTWAEEARMAGRDMP